MTTDLVVTINDEILNELERASTFTNRFMVEVQPHSLQALLSERAELYSDIELLEYTIEGMHTQKAAHAGMADALLRSDKLLTEARREIAELKRDAERAYLRGLTEQKENFEKAYSSTDCWNMCESKTSDGLRAMEAAIDQAMQERQK